MELIYKELLKRRVCIIKQRRIIKLLIVALMASLYFNIDIDLMQSLQKEVNLNNALQKELESCKI